MGHSPRNFAGDFPEKAYQQTCSQPVKAAGRWLTVRAVQGQVKLSGLTEGTGIGESIMHCEGWARKH